MLEHGCYNIISTKSERRREFLATLHKQIIFGRQRSWTRCSSDELTTHALTASSRCETANDDHDKCERHTEPATFVSPVHI